MSKNFFTGRAALLQMFVDDQPIAVGTGFFIRSAVGLALVTARHNLTGRHWQTGKPLAKKTAAIPNKVSINVPIVERKIPGRFGFKEFIVPLFDEGEEPRTLWLEGGPQDCPWDIAVIPIPNHWEAPFIDRWKRHEDLLGDFTVATMCDHLGWANLLTQEHRVGSAAFVLGFPFGQNGGVINHPIWRMGGVATEPSVDWDDLPVFLADVSGRQGMSGSPTIIDVGFRDFLLGGVYTGRILGEQSHSELGYVWKLSAVDTVLREGRSAGQLHGLVSNTD